MPLVDPGAGTVNECRVSGGVRAAAVLGRVPEVEVAPVVGVVVEVVVEVVEGEDADKTRIL